MFKIHLINFPKDLVIIYTHNIYLVAIRYYHKWYAYITHVVIKLKAKIYIFKGNKNITTIYQKRWRNLSQLVLLQKVNHLSV